MGKLADKIGSSLYNNYVKRRNKFVRGEYRVKEKTTKAASYLYSVGNNVVQDVKAGPPKDSYPFRMPKQPKQTKKKRKLSSLEQIRQERKKLNRKRKTRKQPGNPYSLI